MVPGTVQTPEPRPPVSARPTEAIAVMRNAAASVAWRERPTVAPSDIAPLVIASAERYGSVTLLWSAPSGRAPGRPCKRHESTRGARAPRKPATVDMLRYFLEGAARAGRAYC